MTAFPSSDSVWRRINRKQLTEKQRLSENRSDRLGMLRIAARCRADIADRKLEKQHIYAISIK
jgi:hypothetical protein